MRATRYRRAQALVVLLLSALVTASLVLAPLFARAIGEASLAARLADGDTALRLTSWSASERSLVRTPRQLLGLVPADMRAHYGAALLGQFVMVTGAGADRPTPMGWTSQGCDDVVLVDGTCPWSSGEVVAPVSEGTTDRPWTVGTQMTVTESDDATNATADTAPRTQVTVVGMYEPRPGVARDLGLGTGPAQPAPLLGVLDDRWREPHSVARLDLKPATVTLDTLPGLGAQTRAFVARPWAATATTPAEQQATLPVYASSGIPAVADAVATDREQAGITVPVLTVQLAVLLAVVLWLALVAATEQRRAEVAVAKLRGRGADGSRRLLLQETLPPVALGVVLGAVLAILLRYAVVRLVLPGRVPLVIPRGAWLTLVLAAAALLGLAVASVRRVSQEPVAGLLRSVPARGRGLHLGILEAMVVAASVAAFVALATGSVAGPVALAAPTLLAVACGVVGARALPLVLGWGGTRLLRRGRTSAGAALLQASRRPTTRWLVPVVTVGLSLVVFSANAVAVSSRARQDRAGVELGAAAVLTVAPADARAVSAGVTAADPRRQHLTAVALVTPPSTSGPATLAVDPSSFPRIAAWPTSGTPGTGWDRLRPGLPDTLRLTGARLHATVTSAGLVAAPADDGPVPPGPASATLNLLLVGPDGTDRRVALTGLTTAAGTRTVDVAAPCVDTCTVRGIGVSSPVGASASDTITVTRLGTELGGVELRSAREWRAAEGDAGSVSAVGVRDGLRLEVTTSGGADVVLESAGLPASVPALQTPALAASAGGAPTAQAVDGSSLPATVVGSVPVAPGSRAATLVVDYDTLALQRWRGTGSATLLVYSDRADPAYLDTVRDRMTGAGVDVVSTRTRSALASRYAESAAAWSMRLALGIGAMAVLVVALALLVLVQTSARERSRDYASLRMAGLAAGDLRRLAMGELWPVVAVAAVLGVAAGLLAAHAAMPLVPLFATPSSVLAPDLTVAWGPVGAAASVALLVLLATAGAAGTRVARSARLDRLREAA